MIKYTANKEERKSDLLLEWSYKMRVSIRVRK